MNPKLTKTDLIIIGGLIVVAFGIVYSIAHHFRVPEKPKKNKTENQKQNITLVSTESTVELTWDFNETENVSGFRLFKKENGNWIGISEQYFENESGIMPFTLEPPVTGEYRVKAFNNQYESEFSDSIFLVEKSDIPISEKPESLRVLILE